MRCLHLSLLVIIALFTAAPNAQPNAEGAAKTQQTILHLLDYIGVDYPGVVADGKVTNAAEYQEQVEFADIVKARVAELSPHPAQAELAQQAQRLIENINAKLPGAEIAALTGAMRQALIAAYKVETAPKQAPDLAAAATIFEVSCAGCHGAQGRGDGMLAKGMEPAPSNFHDRERQAALSVYGLYSTITLGVEGTAMRGFTELNEAQRWSLAFYAANFAATEEEKRQGESAWQAAVQQPIFSGIGSISSLSPSEAQAKFGDSGRAQLAYLRAHPEMLMQQGDSPLGFSAQKLEQSLAAYARGDHAAAHELAVTSYLEGFELVEAKLDTVDNALRSKIEREMMGFRGLIKSGASIAALTTQANLIRQDLQLAGERLNASSASTSANFLSAFVILLREGLEAILILGGIVAFLIKTSRRDALAYVHMGWMAALALGLVTWVVASQLISISGASRELTEGITAILSAAVLLYVGYWLHGKMYARKWQQFIDTQLKGALKSATLWGLALLSFLTVYREVFETVLFYQTLWAQAGAGARMPILYGFFAAVACLAIIAWLVFSFGMRLPLKLFFGVSSVLIGVLAVIFVGKGIAALQEAGKLPISQLDLPSIPALGIYPNLQGVSLQFIILLCIVGSYLYAYYTSKQPAKPA